VNAKLKSAKAEQERRRRDIPREVLALLPRRSELTPDAVKREMEFLCDDWLVDVETDHAGKCVIVAAALTVIERSLLPDRPVFFVTSGRRGSGKTTTLTMLAMAITGMWPAAAAWSPNEDERRKALLAYLTYGVPFVIWDNIKRGTTISCPHIKKSCTSAYYADRKLGVSELVSTAAVTIHLFTGNNIGAKGDLPSRSLTVRLQSDRADPENREFRHNDPIAWTDDHRAEILWALFTVLLGNPALDAARDAKTRTRFKMWWRLVGSAVEHAAKLTGHDIDFADLFLTQEEENEDDASLFEVFEKMKAQWPYTFKAEDVRRFINAEYDFSPNPSQAVLAMPALRPLLREFFFPELRERDWDMPSNKAVGKRLRKHVDETVGGKDVRLS
jgi:hypothetical protein